MTEHAVSPREFQWLEQRRLCAGALTEPLPEVLHHEKFAGVAQLVEHELPKLEVAGSNPVARSTVTNHQTKIDGPGDGAVSLSTAHEA